MKFKKHVGKEAEYFGIGLQYTWNAKRRPLKQRSRWTPRDTLSRQWVPGTNRTSISSQIYTELLLTIGFIQAIRFPQLAEVSEGHFGTSIVLGADRIIIGGAGFCAVIGGGRHGQHDHEEEAWI